MQSHGIRKRGEELIQQLPDYFILQSMENLRSLFFWLQRLWAGVKSISLRVGLVPSREQGAQYISVELNKDGEEREGCKI